MKILHTADLHIGKKIHGYSLLDEQKKILLEEIPKIIVNEKINAVMIAGDLYDTSVPAAPSVVLCNDFITKLSELEVPVFIIPGNHDSAERISFATDVLKKSKIFIAKPVDTDTTERSLEHFTLEDDYGKVNVFLMPYVKSSDVKNLIDNTDVNSKERNILVTHEFVTGVGVENIISDSEVKNVGGLDNVDVSMFDSFDYVALGHLHAPQRIIRDSIRYSGSILKYSFSEVRQNKSVTVIELGEKGNMNISKIPLTPINDMRVIEGPIEELLSSEVYSNIPVNDYLQVILTDEEEIFDAMNRMRAVYPNVLKIDFNNTKSRARNGVETIEEIEKKSEMDLFEEFYKNRTDQDLSDQAKKIAEEIFHKVRGDI